MTGPTLADGPAPVATVPEGWYPDPWQIAPWRWWDGRQWSPVIYGPYGMAVPTTWQQPAPFVAKGPGIKGGGIAAIGACFGLLGNFAVAIVFIITSGNLVPGNSIAYVVAGEIALWIGFIGATVVASRMNGTGSLTRDYGLSWPNLRDIWTGFVGGVLGRMWPLLVAVLIVLSNGQGFSTPNSTAHSVLGLTPHGTAGWLIVGFVAVVGAPFVEELFFRGLVQGAFTRRVGPVPAIFITALIFSAIHMTNEGLSAPLILFPMALILGYLKHKTGRLAAGMVAHATFNASLFALFLVPAFR